METGIIGQFIAAILGLYWDNGKENGNYCGVLGLCFTIGITMVAMMTRGIRCISLSSQ